MTKITAEHLKQIEKLLEVDDFQVWKFQVTIILKANDLYDIVIADTLESNRNETWKKKDANAQRVIVTTLDKKPMLHVMSCKTAHEMWIKIISIYERDNEQQKCTLLQNFFSLEFDKNADVATNIGRLRNLAVRLNCLDIKIDDNMLMSKILTMLPEEFKHFGTAWESTAREENTGKSYIKITI